MIKIPLAGLRLLLLCALLAIAGSAAAQQPYPSKPIRMIVPYPPGGSTNILARLIGQKFTESWGQPVLVENRGGGNTIIGTEAVAKSAPDGYTLLFATGTHVVIPLLSATPFDPIKDFAPVATVTSGEFMLVLHPSVPANNLREFIALAKSKPGQLNFASAGAGGAPHLAGELFNMMAGVQIQHVPYKGTGPALVDLLSGQVQLYFLGAINALPHVKTGRLKPIAITGKARLPSLPLVPTFAAAGLPEFDVNTWWAILAPAGTPKAIIDKLSGEVANILRLPDISEKLESQGMQPYISTPDQFAALMKADIAKFTKVISAANIKLEN